jgi:hypothetical protein
VAFLAVLVLAVSAGNLRAAGRGEPGPVFPARITLADEEADLRLLHEMDVDIDGVSYGQARVYLVAEELDKLRALGFDVTVLPDEAKAMAEREAARREAAIDSGEPVYHTYETLTSELAALAEEYDGDPGPDIVRLSSIGPCGCRASDSRSRAASCGWCTSPRIRTSRSTRPSSPTSPRCTATRSSARSCASISSST